MNDCVNEGVVVVFETNAAAGEKAAAQPISMPRTATNPAEINNFIILHTIRVVTMKSRKKNNNKQQFRVSTITDE
jgi:hypothetical protein